jgi:hypothetical protein
MVVALFFWGMGGSVVSVRYTNVKCSASFLTIESIELGTRCQQQKQPRWLLRFCRRCAGRFLGRAWCGCSGVWIDDAEIAGKRRATIERISSNQQRWQHSSRTGKPKSSRTPGQRVRHFIVLRPIIAEQSTGHIVRTASTRLSKHEKDS